MAWRGWRERWRDSASGEELIVAVPLLPPRRQHRVAPGVGSQHKRHSHLLLSHSNLDT